MELRLDYELRYKKFLQLDKKQISRMTSTELAFGDNFDEKKIVVGSAIKSKDSNVYWTFPIKYGASQFGIMEIGTVLATKLKDDTEKKPKMLSQGFHLENPQTLSIC